MPLTNRPVRATLANSLIRAPGQKMPDGREITNVGAATGCGDGLLVGTLGVFERYRNGTWDYLADRSLPLATGAPAVNLSASVWDANRGCDVVFADAAGG